MLRQAWLGSGAGNVMQRCDMLGVVGAMLPLLDGGSIKMLLRAAVLGRLPRCRGQGWQ